MPFLTMPALPKHLMISLILFLFSCLFSFDIQSFYFVTLPFVIFSLPISFYILWQFFIYDLVVLFLLHGSSNFIPFQSMESCRVDGVQQDKEQFACLQECQENPSKASSGKKVKPRQVARVLAFSSVAVIKLG